MYYDSYVPFKDFPDVMNVAQMQKALGIGRSTAYGLIRAGEVAHIRIGDTIRIPKQALINYLQENTKTCYNNACSGQAV